MPVLVFIWIFILVFKAVKTKKEEQEKKEAELASKAAARSSSASKSGTARSSSSKSSAGESSLPDPICESYELSREALLALYRDGSISEESFFEGNNELYDSYMRQPMEICRFLRRLGISAQAVVLENKDYIINFSTEDMAWSSCRLLSRSKEVKEISEERRTMSGWAYLPFESADYRLTLMVDRQLGTHKLIVRTKEEEARRRKLTGDELDALQASAFDFTH